MGLCVRNAKQLSRLLNIAKCEDVHRISLGSCRQVLRKQSTISHLHSHNRTLLYGLRNNSRLGTDSNILCHPAWGQKAPVLCGAFSLGSKSTHSDAAPPASKLPGNAETASSSQVSVETDMSLPDGYIPEPPSLTTSMVPEFDLNALGEPTLQSMGLAGWTPSGVVQMALETLHVGLDIPWWGAIVIGTVCVRMLMFPLVIKSQRNSINMGNHMPTVQRLQKKFTEARSSGNPMEAAKAGNELSSYMKRNNVNPFKSMLIPLAQAPVFLSVFWGLRQMSNLPVISMQEGGMLWFCDLTVPDPFYVLPVMTCVTLLVTLEVGTDGAAVGTTSQGVKWALRLMPVAFLPITMNFPAAMLCYWCTSNMFSLLQVLFLRIPAIREYFQIAARVKHKKTDGDQPKQGFVEGVRENWSNSKVAASMEARQRQDAVRFRESGMAPIPKTYPYNPKKIKAGSSIKLQAKSKSG